MYFTYILYTHTRTHTEFWNFSFKIVVAYTRKCKPVVPNLPYLLPYQSLYRTNPDIPVMSHKGQDNNWLHLLQQHHSDVRTGALSGPEVGTGVISGKKGQKNDSQALCVLELQLLTLLVCQSAWLAGRRYADNPSPRALHTPSRQPNDCQWD